VPRGSEAIQHGLSIIDEGFVSVADLHSREFQIFLKYWHLIKGKRLAPPFVEFDFLKLPPELVPNILLSEVDADGDDFVIGFCGPDLAEHFGSVLEGRSTRGLNGNGQACSLHTAHSRTADEMVPIAACIPLTGISGRPQETANILLLPLSEDGIGADKIISYVECAGWSWRSIWWRFK